MHIIFYSCIILGIILLLLPKSIEFYNSHRQITGVIMILIGYYYLNNEKLI